MVGKAVERLDSLGKVLGHSIYTADMIPDNALHMKLVRSSHPHAIIKSLNVSKAAHRRGVRAVITARDVPGTNVSSCIIPDRPLLAHGKVRCVGDIVAAVVADNGEIAETAAKLVKVEYDPLPVITSPLISMDPG